MGKGQRALTHWQGDKVTHTCCWWHCHKGSNHGQQLFYSRLLSSWTVGRQRISITRGKSLEKNHDNLLEVLPPGSSEKQKQRASFPARYYWPRGILRNLFTALYHSRRTPPPMPCWRVLKSIMVWIPWVWVETHISMCSRCILRLKEQVQPPPEQALWSFTSHVHG